MIPFDIPPIPFGALAGALLIFALRVVDVSLGTLRMTMVVRGRRLWAAAIGFAEVTVWVLAVSRVLGQLDNPWNLLGYSGGFAAGTLVGMWLEDRIALGLVDIHIVSPSHGPELVARLRDADYGVTELKGAGRGGAVDVLAVVAPRREAGRVLRMIDAIDRTCFVTVDDMRAVKRGYLPGRARIVK